MPFACAASMKKGSLVALEEGLALRAKSSENDRLGIIVRKTKNDATASGRPYSGKLQMLS